MRELPTIRFTRTSGQRHHLLFYSYTSQAWKNSTTLRHLPKRIIMVHSRKSLRAIRIRLYGVVDDIASLVRRITHDLVGDAPWTIFGDDRSDTCRPRDHVKTSADVVPRQYPERVATKPGNTARHDNILTNINLGALRWGNELNLRQVGRYRYTTGITVSGCRARPWPVRWRRDWGIWGVCRFILDHGGYHGCRCTNQRGHYGGEQTDLRNRDRLVTVVLALRAPWRPRDPP